MKLLLKIDYCCSSGERLLVESGGVRSSLEARYGGVHFGELNLCGGGLLRYKYSVRGGLAPRSEWGDGHSIPFAEGVDSCFVADRWRDMPADKPLYSSLFTDSIFKRIAPLRAELGAGSLMVGVEVAHLEPHHKLVMVGSCAALGEWEVSRGVDMLDGDFPLWRSPSFAICDELLAAEYKFVIVDSASGDVVAWERGANRSFEVLLGRSEQSLYINEVPADFDIPQWRGAGVAIPLFSLRSDDSAGVGEFLDLKKMVDWAVMTNQKIIQILPINDTTMFNTWEDSYPYNANSIYALHPQYISLKRVGALLNDSDMAAMEREAKALNALPQIDYHSVNSLKSRYLHQLFSESGEKTTTQKNYKDFVAKNSYWLENYALYSLLRDKYATPDFGEWGDDSIYSAALLARYKATNANELEYFYFVQYHLHIQLLEAREYAILRGVAFKGDIPIGVSRTSVDVWVDARLFKLDSQAGAPPDDFSVLGQNWGFPTYNWLEMAKDDYAWWRGRFTKMAEYFDAYRIDHILGFFRIWEIPLCAIQGLLGHFSPALPLTKEEMQERYGFTFESSYIEPAINNWLLDHLFGEKKEQIIREYLEPIGINSYRFSEEYSTQQKISNAVEDSELRDALLCLTTEVLFVEEPHTQGYYHPRIAAQGTYKYRAMSDYDKLCYDNLYNDFFYHRHNDFWGEEALRKLPALISSTNMLTCGEDLGMIPHCVADVMEREQILSLEIERMPKESSRLFADTSTYPYRSVCTTSTHDMNPLRAWLREDSQLSNRYFREQLDIDFTMEDDSPPWVIERIIAAHLSSPAMWTILPLQDWLAMDINLRAENTDSERINIPASSRHYWRYRMHCTIEELMASDEFNAKMGEMSRRK